MNPKPNVVIVTARCRSNRQLFGIRFEERLPGIWGGDWAFALKEATSQREGYERNTMQGAFGFIEGYPGCPYCHEHSIMQCGGCGKVSCWDGRNEMTSCGWCGARIRISGTIDQLSGGGDR